MDRMHRPARLIEQLRFNLSGDSCEYEGPAGSRRRAISDTLRRYRCLMTGCGDVPICKTGTGVAFS